MSNKKSSVFQIRRDYFDLLKEQSLDRHSRWSETKKKIDGDSRYKAIDSSSRKEDWFRDYIHRLEDVSNNILLFKPTLATNIIQCSQTGTPNLTTIHYFLIFKLSTDITI